MKLNINNLKFDFKIIENQNLKTIISVNFGEFVIRGFRISESKYKNARGEKLWLTPPSYLDGNQDYHPMFFIPNKKLWKELEDKMFDEYHKASKKHYAKRMNLKNNDI